MSFQSILQSLRATLVIPIALAAVHGPAAAQQYPQQPYQDQPPYQGQPQYPPQQQYQDPNQQQYPQQGDPQYQQPYQPQQGEPQYQQPYQPQQYEQPQDQPPVQGPPYYSPDQLDQMLAPIALYPDPLLAQVLPACAYPQEIDQAARFVQSYGPSGVNSQPWDSVVRAVAHYPQVLNTLDQNLEWTAAVGQAFAYQMSDVTMSVQRLRLAASNAGNLQSGPQLSVNFQDNFITITPANPNVLYIPEYDPQYAFVSNQGYSEPAVNFSAAVGGVWLNFGVDWLGGCVVPYPRGTYWGPGGWRGDRRFTNINYIHNTYNRDNHRYYHINQQRFARYQLPNQQTFARRYAPTAPHAVGRGGFQNRPAFQNQGGANRPQGQVRNVPNRTVLTAPAFHPVGNTGGGNRNGFNRPNGQVQNNQPVRNNNVNDGRNGFNSRPVNQQVQPSRNNVNDGRNGFNNRPVNQQPVRNQTQPNGVRPTNQQPTNSMQANPYLRNQTTVQPQPVRTQTQPQPQNQPTRPLNNQYTMPVRQQPQPTQPVRQTQPVVQPQPVRQTQPVAPAQPQVQARPVTPPQPAQQPRPQGQPPQNGQQTHPHHDKDKDKDKT